MKKFDFKESMNKVFNEKRKGKIKNVIIALLLCVIAVIFMDYIHVPQKNLASANSKINEYQNVTRHNASDTEAYAEGMKNYTEASEIYSKESKEYKEYNSIFTIGNGAVQTFAKIEAEASYLVYVINFVLVIPFIFLGGLLIKYIVIPVAKTVNKYIIKPIISFVNKVRNIFSKRNKKAIA